MLEQLLNERHVPGLRSREEMLATIQEHVYGALPPKPTTLRWEEKKDYIPWFCAGKASYTMVTLTCTIMGQEFSFPVSCVIPTGGGKYPFFVHINFRPDVPDRYQPTEELVDNGFAVLSFCYQDVTKDNPDFTEGLAGILYPAGKRKQNEAGKIALWAWAAQRVMDYAQTLDCLDLNRSCVCGHSRLGKTALLTAATDERFTFCYSNNSGCGGVSLARNTKGETVKAICNLFPYWFCQNYQEYIENEQAMPCDQHYLIASVAPRKVCIGNAWEDVWVEPASELLSALAASPAFEAGIVCEDRLPVIGDVFFDGDIGYHLRAGKHYFSRGDWLKLMDFINRKTTE